MRVTTDETPLRLDDDLTQSTSQIGDTMSETMREAIPIIFMYFNVFLLAPFIGFAMWSAFDGDRMRAQGDADEVEVDQTATRPTTDPQPQPTRASSAASSAA